MALDKLRTASGRRLRGEALTETALPVPYDAAAMPGAIVLGTDGRLYGSVRNPASAPFAWQSLPASGTEMVDVTGNIKASGSFIAGTNILSGITQPRTNFVRNIPIGPIAYSPAAQFEYLENIDSSASGETVPSLSVVSIGGPGRCVLGRANGNALGDSGAVSNAEPLAHYFAYGSDGTNLVAAARVRCIVDGTISSGNVPGAFLIGTAVAGSPNAISDHLRVTSTGNVIINNTTGTGRLSVTGNIQVTETTDGFLVEIGRAHV